MMLTIKAEDEQEAEWEAAMLLAVLGDALQPDGELDYDQLHQQTIPTTLEALYPEGSKVDES
jgi:hypothetical protein